MFRRGEEFLLRVEGRRLLFSERDFLPLEKVFLDHPDEKGMAIEAFSADRFLWIKVWVQRFEDGVLDCDISDFNPSSTGFPKQSVDVSKVRKMLLFVDSEKVLALAMPKPKAWPVSPPIPRMVVALPKKPLSPAVFEENIGFELPLEQVRFAEGCAVVKWAGQLPESRKLVRLKVVVKNSFLSKKLNCIRSYLAKCIGKVDFRATVRVSGEEVEVLGAESKAIASISSEVIGEVRYHYAKGELRKWNQRKERVITAEDFFGKIKAAGFGESDEGFIADILRVKKPKHSAHIEYLAEHHRSDLIRLRIVKIPFAFLCFLSGRTNGYFVWETLDGTDATYVWKHEQSVDYLVAHKAEFRHWLAWVEKQIDLIYAAGRDEYWRSALENFTRIIHNYRDEDGFAKWKTEVEKLLDGADG